MTRQRKTGLWRFQGAAGISGRRLAVATRAEPEPPAHISTTKTIPPKGHPMKNALIALALVFAAAGASAQATTAAKEAGKATAETAKQATENTKAAVSSEPRKSVHKAKAKMHKAKAKEAGHESKEAAKAAVK
jgi:hypothetical protein